MSKAKPGETYDAIVVGTGISGGWAAKELCEHGFKTLVLERGRMVRHIKDYPTMNMDPWDFEFKGQLPRGGRKKAVETGTYRLHYKCCAQSFFCE